MAAPPGFARQLVGINVDKTANILNNATERSLIIPDEIRRGTSIYDGLSIAWAVVEHLHRAPERGPRTLFATHYQELTQLDKHLPRLRKEISEHQRILWQGSG